MKVLVVTNEKGGVAKTTLSVNLASYYAAVGYRVLLVDADAQGHTSVSLGTERAPGLYNLIVRDEEYKNVARPIPPERYTPDGQSRGQLLLLPGNAETAIIENWIAKEGEVFVFQERFAQLDGLIDLIIIDTAPTPSQLHTSIYFATDTLLAPTIPEYMSMVSLVDTLSRVQVAGARRGKMGLDPISMAGIVPTLYLPQTVEHQENLKVLQDKYAHLLLDPIPSRTIWREASSARLSIFAYAPQSRAAIELTALAQRMEGSLFDAT